MSVTNTLIRSDPCGDGRLYVVFIFTFSSGDIERDGPRFLPAAEDLNALASIIGARLEAQLKDRELYFAVFTATWDYILKYSTNTELAAYVRSLYKESNKETLARVAKRILEWIANGRYTDTQVRNAFGLNNTQWTTLKTKMQNLADSLNAVEAGAGE